MAKKTVQYASNHQAELGKLLRSVGYRHGLWQVFRDFVAMSALAISNAVDRGQYAAREAEYLKIVERYTKEEANEIARGLSLVVMGLEAGMSDFLGSLFMSLELGDSWKGQFFTPYEVSRLMAQMSLGDDTQAKIERKGFISVCDPCIGGGAMIIGAAHALHDAGINYQQHMHVVAVDVDIVSVHMAYIQLSLLHIPAIVYHGNSLSNEIWSAWRTPAHVVGFWDAKLRHADQAEHVATSSPTPASSQEIVVHSTDAIDVESIEVPVQILPSGGISVRGQMALF